MPLRVEDCGAIGSVGRVRGAARRSGRRGFTLLEVMIVLVIIGVIGGIVAINLVGAADRSKEQASLEKARQIRSALQIYRTTYNDYPPTGQLGVLLQQNVLTQSGMLDAWNREFHYMSPAGDFAFVIVSAGIDGQLETEDDIVMWPED
ncbi:MAG: type II secretion system protein GspG [Phycisphaerales bacterium]